MSTTSGTAKVFAFTLPIEVSLRDLDALGHVNNAVYSTYLETARNRWVFGLRGMRTAQEFDFILARTAINFRSAASLHETLHVALRPTRLGNSSWDLEYEVREARSARLVVDAESVQVMYNYASGRPWPLEGEFRRSLEAERKRCGGDEGTAMRLLLALALRNLLRHRRRTGLTVAALVLGIAILSLSQAWIAAMERAVVEPAKNATLGHVQVFRADAAEDEGGEVSFIAPQNNYRLIEQPDDLVSRVLAAEPRLSAGLSRLMIGALLSSGEKSMEGILVGIDPRARAAVYPDLALRSGRFFAPGEAGVLVNRNVARKLGIGAGDTLVALATTGDGRLNGVKLRVTGIWTTRGLEAYEWGTCFADLASVQDLVDAGAAAGLLVLRQRDPRAPAAPIAATLNRWFALSGVNARAYTWEEMGGPFLGGMLVTRFIAGIAGVVLAIIVAAGVTNTALMAVFERTREIGTLRAMGTRRGRVVVLFLLEAFLLGLAGAAGGALLGAGLVAFLGRVGIPAFSEAQRYSYGGDHLYPTLAGTGVVAVPVLMLALTVLAALGPALMAARMSPAAALRHV